MTGAAAWTAAATALALLIVGLAYWQVRARPHAVLKWAAWSVAYAVFAALAFSTSGGRVSAWWGLLAGPIFASLQIVRIQASGPGPLAKARVFTHQDVSHPAGDRVAVVAAILAIGAAAWALLWPRPYAWALAPVGLAPWAATVGGFLWRKHIVPIGRPDLEHRPTMTPLILAGLVSLRVVVDLDVVPQTAGVLVAWGCGGAALLLGLWMLSSSSLYATPAMATVAAFLALTIAFGSILALNVAFDRAPATVAKGIVVAKQFTSGQGGRHELTLAEPFPPAGSNRVRISGGRFARTLVGAPICAAHHRGALGIGWYEFVRCTL